MLTGHSDASLVDIAIQLDVNSFVLKPVTKDSLGDRLHELLRIDPYDDSWIKSPEMHETLDVDTRIFGILKENAASQIPVKPPKTKGPDGEDVPGMKSIEINQIKAGMKLCRDIEGHNGQIYIKANTLLTARHSMHLRDLVAMDLIEKFIWITTEP